MEVQSPCGPWCVCEEGFRASESGCVDVDECAQGTHTCTSGSADGTCTNTDGSFTCTCINEGVNSLHVDGESGPYCENVNECEIECNAGARLNTACNDCNVSGGQICVGRHRRRKAAEETA